MREMASGEGAALVVLRCSDSIHQQPFQLHYRLHVLYLVGELNQTVTEVHRTASPIYSCHPGFLWDGDDGGAFEA